MATSAPRGRRPPAGAMSSENKKSHGKNRPSTSTKDATINSEPLFKGYVEPNPPTQDLNSDDDMNAFVRQKSARRHHNNVVRRASASTSEQDSSDEGALKCPKEHYIFVANVKRHMNQAYIKQTFNKYGKIVDIAIVSRDANSLPYAYLAFRALGSAQAVRAIKDIPSAREPHHIFRVEQRKTFPQSTAKDLSPQDPSSSSKKTPVGEESAFVAYYPPANSGWLQELENFNWKACASKYLYRVVTMEDYLVEYIHTQASYRQLDEELIETMVNRLKDLAENEPPDVTDMMPPHVSGVVYNQTRDPGNYLDTLSKLLPLEKFRIEGNKIFYSAKLSKELARQKLKEILVEGLFVYFFAKFCHGPKFKIKVSFYQRSEPIKSALIAVTGKQDIQEAIQTFFDVYRDVFCYDSESGDLVMRRDYFDKEYKEDMKAHLDEPSHKHPVMQMITEAVLPASQQQKQQVAQKPRDGPKERSNVKKDVNNNNMVCLSFGGLSQRRNRHRELLNAEGYVSAIVDDHRGEIAFKMPGANEFLNVGFKRKDTYVSGKRMTANINLINQLSLGDVVYFNAHVYLHGGHLVGNCAHVWKGKPPAFLEKIIADKIAEMKEVKEAASGDAKIWKKIKGEICSVITKKCGYIRFIIADQKMEAFFSVDNYPPYQDCELTEAFLERPVVFDVEKQVLHRGVCYRALTVKDDGKVATVEAAQPMSFRPFEDEFPALVSPSQQAGVIPVAQTQPCPRDDLEEYLSDSIDILLGPPAATAGKREMDEGLAGLPPQVASVYQFVFEEEAEVASTRGQLSNPVAIDTVLDHLEGNRKLTSSERSKLKTDVEEAIRKMVSKFLADRDN